MTLFTLAIAEIAPVQICSNFQQMCTKEEENHQANQKYLYPYGVFTVNFGVCTK